MQRVPLQLEDGVVSGVVRRLFPDPNPWAPVHLQDPRARRLADRHYSRQTPGARDMLPPGRRLLMLTEDAGAVWGVCENMDPAGRWHWRVSLFRRESGLRSSDLISLATESTIAYWLSRYGGLPAVPLTTEVDPAAVRRKRDPGRCFRRAGWEVIGPTRSHRHRGAIVLRFGSGPRPHGCCVMGRPEHVHS